MSIKLQSRVWDSTLETGLKIVLGMVCDAANDAGVCWPSSQPIATDGNRPPAGGGAKHRQQAAAELLHGESHL